MEESTPTPITTPETNHTPPRQPKSVLALAGSLLVAFALGMGSGYLVWARPLEARAKAAENQLAAQQAAEQAAAAPSGEEAPQQVKRYDVPVDDDPILGNPDAPITIIEFSDYQCPFCTRWHDEVLPQIKAKYGDQVRLVYRDFPLDGIHPEARPAAEAANCANEQDKFWEFHDQLFAGGQNLNRQVYEMYAQNLSLNMDNFTTCLDEQRYAQEVEDDLQYASVLGVRSTPTFFINGLAVVGAQPFEVFEQVIDMELAGEIPQE